MTAHLSLCANLPSFIALPGCLQALAGRIPLLMALHIQISVQSSFARILINFLGQQVP